MPYDPKTGTFTPLVNTLQEAQKASNPFYGLPGYVGGASAAGNVGVSSDPNPDARTSMGFINFACHPNPDGSCNWDATLKKLDDEIEYAKSFITTRLPRATKDPVKGWIFSNQSNPTDFLIRSGTVGKHGSGAESGIATINLRNSDVNVQIDYVSNDDVNKKIDELINISTQGSKIWNAFNFNPQGNQAAYQNAIAALDKLAVDPEFTKVFGTETTNEILNETQSQVLNYHWEKFIPAVRNNYLNNVKLQEPPIGDFDAQYYAQQNPSAVTIYNSINGLDPNSPYINIYELGKYGTNAADFQEYGTAKYNFLKGHYSARVLNPDGTPNNDYYTIRANNPVTAAKAANFSAQLSEQEKQNISEQYLGINTPTEYKDISYDGQLIENALVETEGYNASDYYQNISALKGTEGQNTIKDLLTQDNPTNISQAELAITNTVTNKLADQTLQFGVLAKQALTETINEINRQRQQEEYMQMVSGIGSIQELKTLGSDLADQIMGGLNFGGFNPLQDKFDQLGEKLKTDFEKLSPFSDSRNNVIYNWQKWFSDTFDEDYGRDKFEDVLNEALATTPNGDAETTAYEKKLLTAIGTGFQEKNGPIFGTPQEILKDTEIPDKYGLQRTNSTILEDAFYSKNLEASVPAKEKLLQTIALTSASGQAISKDNQAKDFSLLLNEGGLAANTNGNRVIRSYLTELNNGNNKTSAVGKDFIKSGGDNAEQLLNGIGFNAQAAEIGGLSTKALYETLIRKIDAPNTFLSSGSNIFKGTTRWIGESTINNSELKKILEATLANVQPIGSNTASFSSTAYKAPSDNYLSYEITIDPATTSLTYGSNFDQKMYPPGTPVPASVAQYYKPLKTNFTYSSKVYLTLKDEYKWKPEYNHLPNSLSVETPEIAKSDRSISNEVGLTTKLFNVDVLKKLGYNIQSQRDIVDASAELTDKIKTLGGKAILNPTTGSKKFTAGELLLSVINGDNLDYYTKDLGFTNRTKAGTYQNLKRIFELNPSLGVIENPGLQVIDKDLLTKLGYTESEYGSFNTVTNPMQGYENLENATKAFLADLQKTNQAEIGTLLLGDNAYTNSGLDTTKIFDLLNANPTTSKYLLGKINLTNQTGINFQSIDELKKELDSYMNNKNTVLMSPELLNRLGFTESTYGDFDRLQNLVTANEAAMNFVNTALGSKAYAFQRLLSDFTLPATEKLQAAVTDLAPDVDLKDKYMTTYAPEILKSAGFGEDKYGSFSNLENHYAASRAFRLSMNADSTKEGKAIDGLLDSLTKDSITGNGSLNIEQVKNTLNSTFGYRIDLLDKNYEVYDPEFLTRMGFLEEESDTYTPTAEDIYKASLNFEYDLVEKLEEKYGKGTDIVDEMFSIIDSRDYKEGIRETFNYTNDLYDLNLDPLQLERFFVGGVEIDYEFSQNFIKEFLEPRFDYSEDMDEFKSYMEVNAMEKNIFQTIDTLTLAREAAASAMYDYTNILKRYQEEGSTFNVDWYLNPLATDKGYPFILEENKGFLKEQAERVQADWASIKQSLNNKATPNLTWNQLAYYYGIDPQTLITDPATFAKLHYQIIGADKGYQAAPPLYTAADIQKYINETLVPKLNDVLAEQNNLPFGRFERPEEYAEDLINSIVKNKPAYEKMLQAMGYADANGVIEEGVAPDEVKETLIETLRSVPASAIRLKIQELDKLKEDPTQVNLGLLYIPREPPFLEYEQKDNSGKVIELSGEKNYLNDIVSKLTLANRAKLVTALKYETDPTDDQLKADLLKILQMKNAWQVRELKRDLDNLAKGTSTILDENLIVPTDQELQQYLEANKPEEETGSPFYKMFKQAGYQGDEDTFYEELFADQNREELDFLGSAMSGKLGSMTLSEKLKDPWSAMSFVESFGEDDSTEDFSPTSSPWEFINKLSGKDEQEKEKTFSSLFDLNLEDDEKTSTTSSDTKDPFFSGFMSLFS